MAGEAAGVEIVARRGRLVRRALAGWACLIYFFLFSPIVLLILLSFNKNRYGIIPDHRLDVPLVLEHRQQPRPAVGDQDLVAGGPRGHR